jgi:hypothetical protein
MVKRNAQQTVRGQPGHLSQHSPVASDATSSVLSYPLTVEALQNAFAALKPEHIRVDSGIGRDEAVVDGEWSLSRLRAHFKAMGYKKTGDTDSLAFVNDENTVGFVLFGVAPHPTKNTWRTYTIEVQARSLDVARGLHAPGPGLMGIGCS